MANYVDAFVLPVPKKNIEAYKKIAKKCSKIWMEYGALQYIECIEEDVKPGKLTSFPQSVKLKKDEVVFFSWIIYKSKSHREKVLKKVMSDKRMEMIGPNQVPFDSKRMFWGVFKQVVVA